MALNYINKINVGGVTYNIGTNSVLVFVGTTDDENLINGYSGAITITNGTETETYDPKVKGYVVIKGTKEFVSNGAEWVELGDESWTISTTSADAVDSVTVGTLAAITGIEFTPQDVVTGIDGTKLTKKFVEDGITFTANVVGDLDVDASDFVKTVSATTETVSVTGTTAMFMTDVDSSSSHFSDVCSNLSASKITEVSTSVLPSTQKEVLASVSLAKDVVTAVSAGSTASVVTGITTVSSTISVANETLIIPDVTLLKSASVTGTAAAVTGISATAEGSAAVLTTSNEYVQSITNTTAAFVTAVNYSSVNGYVINDTNSAYITSVGVGDNSAAALISASLDKQVVTGVSSTTGSALTEVDLDNKWTAASLTYTSSAALTTGALKSASVLGAVKTLTTEPVVKSVDVTKSAFLKTATKSIG